MPPGLEVGATAHFRVSSRDEAADAAKGAWARIPRPAREPPPSCGDVLNLEMIAPLAQRRPHGCISAAASTAIRARRNWWRNHIRPRGCACCRRRAERVHSVLRPSLPAHRSSSRQIHPMSRLSSQAISSITVPPSNRRACHRLRILVTVIDRSITSTRHKPCKWRRPPPGSSSTRIFRTGSIPTPSPPAMRPPLFSCRRGNPQRIPFSATIPRNPPTAQSSHTTSNSWSVASRAPLRRSQSCSPMY